MPCRLPAEPSAILFGQLQLSGWRLGQGAPGRCQSGMAFRRNLCPIGIIIANLTRPGGRLEAFIITVGRPSVPSWQGSVLVNGRGGHAGGYAITGGSFNLAPWPLIRTTSCKHLSLQMELECGSLTTPREKLAQIWPKLSRMADTSRSNWPMSPCYAACLGRSGPKYRLA